MNPTLTTLATFSIGLFCGYLLRKNWYLIRAVLNKKPSKNTNKDPKIDMPKETSKELFTEEAESPTNVIVSSTNN